MDIQELLKSLGLSVARGVPQMASGFVDLAALPFTATGLLKPEQAVGSTDWMTARGYLPPKQEGLLSESAEMASSMLSPAGATKAGLLALGMAATKGKGGKALNSILKTQYDEAMEVAQKNAALPVSEGGLGLPPDNTAMDRAKAMGIDTPGFHATGADIKQIDTNMVGKSDYGTIGQGFYIDPSENAAYSNLVARINQPKSPQNIMPVMFDKKDLYDMTGVVGLRSAEQSKQITENLKNAGYKGTFTSLPDGSINEVAIFDPSIVRSRFAAFDPKRIDENNLLASLLASLGVGGLLYTPDEEEQY